MKRINIDHIEKGKAFIVKWQYGLLTGFEKNLAEAMNKADIDDIKKLMSVYPDEMSAMNNFKRTPNWWNSLLVELDLCPVLFI